MISTDHIRSQTVCPYTGLRSFTEEESLYFKGRDQQIDMISSLLEQNKFLMVTGASGEGKSSLIYAGLVPNARAGFFKAKYTNWVVADFRPERSPVKNMAQALAEKFELATSTVETELRRGYSSLVDLYSNSTYFTDEQDEAWTSLSEERKKSKRRETANLLILVDQFEEFFTNPENFYKEAPSQDSQIVVNLILETARVALKKNLPIYIVCTMRSDYIGQCAAFRGLPEYIGFSQFFVPRLKRKDLKQVIEEPAILSGNRISQRLIERLVFDLAEGIDQLPILQHALSQIWLAADHGLEEMDLIHYAKVGGMPADELPDEDQVLFLQWLDSLPSYKKGYYSQTGLQKIIEIHANSLYESAWEYHNQQSPENPITKQEAKRIIALTFACLTKIDHSRAVRNRMSLEEITAIINIPGLKTETVDKVISIFREDENAFIRPFKTEDADSHILSSTTVLDITHESLIRNWNKLIQWAKQEFEFYSSYLDFKKQLDRWTRSGKDSGYLLPIGPLTHFENWYNSCKPNVGWIKRYSEVNEDRQRAEQDALGQLTDTREFLKRSASKVRFTRAFMKYGPRRIAIGLAILFMILLSGFYWYDAEQKQNDQVIEKVRKQTSKLMQSEEIGIDIKANQLIVEERFKSGTLIPYLESLEPKSRINNSIEVYKQLIELDKVGGLGLKPALLDFIKNNLDSFYTRSSDPALLLTQVNKFSILLSYDNYYNLQARTENILQQNADLGYQLTLKHFTDSALFRPGQAYELNKSIQWWLSFGQARPEQIGALLQLISPFENEQARRLFNTYYPKGSYEMNGRISNDFNGGYHTLVTLYAAWGQPEKVITCFETLKQSGQNDYFIGSLFNNYTHVLGLFYQFGHQAQASKMVEWLSANYESNTPLTIYRNAVIRSGYLSHLFRVNLEPNLFRSFRGTFFPTLCLTNRTVFAALCDEYERQIAKIVNPDERNYLFSLQAKRRAMFTHKWNYDRGLPSDSTQLNQWLDKSIQFFRSVDTNYLKQTVASTIPYYTDGVRNRQFTRKQLLIYPDYMDGWFSWTFHSDLFFNYLNKKNLLSDYYKTAADLEMIHWWIAKANERKPFSFSATFDNTYSLSDKVYQTVLSFADAHPQGKVFDRNLIYLILANRAFVRRDSIESMHYFALFDQKGFAGSYNRYEYIEKTFFLNQIKDLAVNLADAGQIKPAVELAELFEKTHEQALAYIFMSERIFSKKEDPYAFVYLDSVFSKFNRIDFSQFPGTLIDPRYRLIQLLTRIGSVRINQQALSIFRGIPEGNKPNALFNMINGVTEEGNFYRAVSSIPNRLTESEDLICRFLIVNHAARKKETPEQAAQWGPLDYFVDHDFYYVFYLPN